MSDGFPAEDLRRLRELTGCGMHEAELALALRDGDMTLAEEWIRRHALAAVMSPQVRFPLYYGSLRKAPVIQLGNSWGTRKKPEQS